MTPQDKQEWEDLMGTPLSESVLKIDMGIAVTADEKQALWPNEERTHAVYRGGGPISEADWLNRERGWQGEF